MKYYYIVAEQSHISWTENRKKGFVSDCHPFEWLRTKGKSVGVVVILEWREITKEEYDLYKN